MLHTHLRDTRISYISRRRAVLTLAGAGFLAMVRLPSSRPPRRIQQRQLELRARLWPDLKPGDVWSRHTNDGFSTIPSTMPLIMSIIDDLSNGRPASMPYLDLWTRSYDEGFVTLTKSREMAFHSGFATQRAERTWRQKLEVLAELHFIDIKSGPLGAASYALLWNPYLVIKWYHDEKHAGLREGKFNALVARALEIGDRTFASAPASLATETPPVLAPGVNPNLAVVSPTAAPAVSRSLESTGTASSG